MNTASAERVDADVFAAIANPVRRALLDALRQQPRRPVNQLASGFTPSRPAISQHLHILLHARLVEEQRVGRQRLYTLRAEPLREVRDWVDAYEAFWTGRLVELRAVLDKQP